MNYLVLVNKNNLLEKSYKPANLVKVTKLVTEDKEVFLEILTRENAMKFLSDAKNALKVKVIIESGYRSFFYQENLIKEEMKKRKLEEILKTMAFPGASEHQTGLAFDLGFVIDGVNIFNFDVNKYSSLYDWLHKNAFKYGFILRYPKGKESITGINYEPWHFRYVGFYHAKKMFDRSLTLEEYLLCDIL